MLRLFSNHSLIYGILFLALALRLPGLWWGGLQPHPLTVLQMDENQHLDLSMQLIQKIRPGSYENKNYKRSNTYALATQMTLAAWPLLHFKETDRRLLLITGRLLSILYGLMLAWLIYRICLYHYRDYFIAHAAALGVALFDILVTYSHYAIPEMAYLFWWFFAAYSSHQFLQNISTASLWKDKKKWGLWATCLFSMSMTLSLKFDFIPVILFFGAVFFMTIFGKIKRGTGLAILLMSLPLLLLFFKLFNGIYPDWTAVFKVFETLKRENSEIIEQGNSLIVNPVLYLIALITGIGIPAFLLGLFGCKYKIVAAFNIRSWTKQWSLIRWILLGLILEYFLLMMLNVPVVRRVLIFAPFLAVLFGIGLKKLYASNFKFNNLTASLIMLYTFFLTAVSQYNFIHDNRYDARNFALTLDQNKTFYSDYYSNVSSMPINRKDRDKAEYLIIHEVTYCRYWKTFTTPFKIPHCCDEVYHCESEERCQFFQKILSGSPEFTLLYHSQPYDWAPERLLFKKWFGTYETFLGDSRVYRHNKLKQVDD